MRKETLAEENGKQILYHQGQQVTPAYVHWLADVHSAVFAPAFPLSLGRQEIRPQTANAHSLSRYGALYKKKENNILSQTNN